MSAWWLVTWTTHNSWLPGDPRGFQTWRGREYIPPPSRYAKPGENVYDPSEYEELHEYFKETSGPPVKLNREQLTAIRDSIVDELRSMQMFPVNMCLAPQHGHLFAKFGALKIRPTMGRLKARATRDLHFAGFKEERVWSRCCHMKSKNTESEALGSWKYIDDHRAEDCVVHAWMTKQELIEAFDGE